MQSEDVSKYYFLDADCTDDADKQLIIRVFRVICV